MTEKTENSNIKEVEIKIENLEGNLALGGDLKENEKLYEYLETKGKDSESGPILERALKKLEVIKEITKLQKKLENLVADEERMVEIYTEFKGEDGKHETSETGERSPDETEGFEWSAGDHYEEKLTKGETIETPKTKKGNFWRNMFKI